jgi:hypothetical protein
MFASARLPTIALMVSIAFAFETAPAMAQAPDDQDHGLPQTPPPVESSTTQDESAAPPSGSVGFALFGVIFGPLGVALGGASAAAAGLDFGARTHSVGSPVGQDRPIQ